MVRETFVYRNGKVVEKQHAGPRSERVHVISDYLGDQLEHHGYADGRRTDSKSTFRRWTKEAGLVEKGNDREHPRPMDAKTYSRDLQGDVAQSIQMLRQGYRPRLMNIEGD